MTEQLQEMKARLEAATPGPWIKDPDEPVHIMRPDKPGSFWDGTAIATLQRDDFGLFEEANADLIAHAPETQAKLFAALEAALTAADALIEENQDASTLQSWGLTVAARQIRQAITEVLA